MGALAVAVHLDAGEIGGRSCTSAKLIQIRHGTICAKAGVAVTIGAANVTKGFTSRSCSLFTLPSTYSTVQACRDWSIYLSKADVLNKLNFSIPATKLPNDLCTFIPCRPPQKLNSIYSNPPRMIQKRHRSQTGSTGHICSLQHSFKELLGGRQCRKISAKLSWLCVR